MAALSSAGPHETKMVVLLKSSMASSPGGSGPKKRSQMTGQHPFIYISLILGSITFYRLSIFFVWLTTLDIKKNLGGGGALEFGFGGCVQLTTQNT